MTDSLAFTLAALTLLATPGPTNTLLAASGAAAGFGRSLHLIVAETLGYLISITTLALVIGPLAHGSSALNVALRAACGLYLLYAAWRLWRESNHAQTSDEPVRFRDVLAATLLNPKAIVFAYLIVPHLAYGRVTQSLPYMTGLAVMIGIAGSAWIAAGAMARTAAHPQAGFVRRTGALVLCLFAVLIAGSSFSA